MDYDRIAVGEQCRQAALMYLQWGWSVIPICPPDHIGVGKKHVKECKTPGKRPLVDWTEFQKRLASMDEVERWWRQWPNANVGVVMGQVSSLVGIDIDGIGGAEALQELAGEIKDHVLAFTSPSGGQRLLFALATNTERLGPKFFSFAKHEEIRGLGEGTQTVVPPSWHPSGGPYTWTFPIRTG